MIKNSCSKCIRDSHWRWFYFAHVYNKIEVIWSIGVLDCLFLFIEFVNQSSCHTSEMSKLLWVWWTAFVIFLLLTNRKVFYILQDSTIGDVTSKLINCLVKLKSITQLTNVNYNIAEMSVIFHMLKLLTVHYCTEKQDGKYYYNPWNMVIHLLCSLT